MNASTSAPVINFRGVYKRFVTPSGGTYTALRDLNFRVEPGEFCALVGPTGCGKSTTLALISGVEVPSAGDVRVFGEPVNGMGSDLGAGVEPGAISRGQSVLGNGAAA